MSNAPALKVDHLVATVEPTGESLDQIAVEITEAVVAAAGDSDTVFVGPFASIADEGGAFGLHLIFAHPGGPLCFFADMVGDGLDLRAPVVRDLLRSAIIAALGSKFRRVLSFASLRQLFDAAGPSLPEPSRLSH
jgi:hypothetical protein